MSQASNSSSKRMEGSYELKKKKLHPRPEFEEDLKSSHSKKLKTGTKSISKSKISTQNKCEVTFSEDVEEIKDASKNKENLPNLDETPLKNNSPNKHILKSVKDHVKTPYSKVKENESDATPGKQSANKSKHTSVSKQPNFSGEIVNKSGKKVRDTTPKRSAKKLEAKSLSKSPLVKIEEEKTESEKNNNKTSADSSEKKEKLENGTVGEKEILSETKTKQKSLIGADKKEIKEEINSEAKEEINSEAKDEISSEAKDETSSKAKEERLEVQQIEKAPEQRSCENTDIEPSKENYTL